MELYPLKFKPIFKERIWGGTKLETRFKKNLEGNTKIGESWELSAVAGSVSVIENGSLAGNSLQEMIEVYMDEMVGGKVFEKYGNEFPLLIKFIDANDDLSIQVHPDDKVAKERHRAMGKTEMWLALDDAEAPQLISGFSKKTGRAEFLEKLKDGSLTELFNYEQVNKGDVFFVPAGRVHAICKGNLIAEIQQTSDITYRIYDYDRKDENGLGRELHLDMSLDVMDYARVEDAKTRYEAKINEPIELVSCNYFTTNLLHLTHKAQRDYFEFDSFVILICTEGNCRVGDKDGIKTSMKEGDTVLLPAALHNVEFEPLDGDVKLLEVYIK